MQDKRNRPRYARPIFFLRLQFSPRIQSRLRGFFSSSLSTGGEEGVGTNPRNFPQDAHSCRLIAPHGMRFRGVPSQEQMKNRSHIAPPRKNNWSYRKAEPLLAEGAALMTTGYASKQSSPSEGCAPKPIRNGMHKGKDSEYRLPQQVILRTSAQAG